MVGDGFPFWEFSGGEVCGICDEGDEFFLGGCFGEFFGAGHDGVVGEIWIVFAAAEGDGAVDEFGLGIGEAEFCVSEGVCINAF